MSARLLAERLLEVVREPFALLLDPDARIFWLYLVVALLIAIAAGLGLERATFRAALRRAFSRDLWLHPSSRVDVALVLIRPLLKLLAFTPVVLSAHAIAVQVAVSLAHTFGRAPTAGVAVGVIAVAYTAVLFVASDFSRFALHLAAHRIPLFWQFHQVHHSAEVLTPLSLYRLHPVEIALQSIRSSLVLGGVTGLFTWLGQGQASVLELMGVNVPAFAFNLLGANLRHSEVFLSYGRVVERVFISPAQHQLHHAMGPDHRHENLGHCFALWDLAVGTWRSAAEMERPPVGLEAVHLNHDPRRFISTLTGPLAAALMPLLGRLPLPAPTAARPPDERAEPSPG